MPETGAVAAIITAAIALGSLLGLVLRRLPMSVFVVVTENPYVITALCGAVSVLFGSLTAVARMVIQRTDKAHEAEKASIIAGKDAVILVEQARRIESEERATRYEQMTLRLLRAAQDATNVATEAVKRGEK